MSDKLICSSCQEPATVLHQSYVDGSEECARCALANDPFMNEQQVRRLQESIRKSAQARRNFGHEQAA